MNFEPVEFVYKYNDKKAFGFIAEEIYKLYPELILNHPLTGEIETIDYTQIVCLILKLLQIQYVKIKRNNDIIKSLINVLF